MTGPYQPPSNQPGGDGWPGGDVNSPFGLSGPAPSSDDKKSSEDEASPYEGVQYELEGSPATPPPPSYGPTSAPPISGPPVTGPPPPAYGPPAPAYGPAPGFTPPPAKKSSSGLLIGGIAAGVVVLLIFVAIVVVIVVNSTSGSKDDAKYQALGSDPCSQIDLSTVKAMVDFGSTPTGTTSTYGDTSNSYCSGTMNNSDYSVLGLFSMTVYVEGTVDSAKTEYDSDKSSQFTGCSGSDVSGSWEQGYLGSGSGCYSASSGSKGVVFVFQDGNLSGYVQMYVTESAASGIEDSAKAVAESVLDKAKK
ncbi:MAG TPA: hypothetical protein VE172_24935 [Stackebrandtia sp.]|uniref:hypothetical protein n=1 Tax=Stackebrandtia sp. TaxID=2023065 RepID=UPI002D6B6851|nr:hypothetical protein [Stackebrandtia sp.]HZE42055.1 hypothetical protein [Stackebrandtia sp.]